ncbi:MAG: terminase small subunit [Betaproteobacteria bacterium]|nr:terminase small subunit [Betaproteobacteria bacterium]
MGKKVNQTELAEILGVTDVTLWEWQKDGMPIEQRGERGQANVYDTTACIDWRIERELAKRGKETQRDRLTRLQADALERENAIKAATLVPAEEIEPVWRGRVFAAAAFLLGQRSRLAGLLEAAPGIEAKRTLLEREFTEFLTRLGVDGAAMQAEVDDLLAKLFEADAANLLARFNLKERDTENHDDQSNAAGPVGPGLGGVRPDPADPAVGVG